MNLRAKTFMALALAGVAVFAGSFAWRASAREQGQIREFTISADRFAYAPARLEVQKDDLVKITFSAADIAHSFTIDSYRIAKRASAGQSVTFEFRADQAGSFPFYCNLTQDDRCRQMKGELVVR
jgi:heme/copper-type cytochrome/quinol oxidase subunit 2